MATLPPGTQAPAGRLAAPDPALWLEIQEGMQTIMTGVGDA
jgi:hypothetical protein